MFRLLLNADCHAPDRLGRQHLLVCDERIAWMGTELPDIDERLGVERVDLDGARLIPGFIDGHAHLTGGGGESGYASRVPPVPLSRFTRAGVTTAVGVLGTDDVVRTTASLVAQARALTDEGLSAFCHCGGYHVPPVTLTGSVRSDIVHLDPIIGVGEVALSDHRSSQPTRDELLRIAANAHVAGMMSGKAGIVHLHLGDGPRGLELVRQCLGGSELPARVFNPTHVNRRGALFEEALDLARQGATVDLTAYPGPEREKGLTAANGLARYLDAGLPGDRITVSSDGGGCLPRFNEHGEIVEMGVGDSMALSETLQTLLADGVPLERCLPAFTRNVAQLLRLHRKGRIAVGKDADLVVLDEAGAPRDVMARGRWHVRDGRQEVVGQFEESV